jgi:hypothetical protein
LNQPWPDGWDEKQDRLRQKDLDARWTQKNGINYYGYKTAYASILTMDSSADMLLH